MNGGQGREPSTPAPTKRPIPGQEPVSVNDLPSDPKFIAYSRGFEIIPYENVLAVSESYSTGKGIDVFIKGSKNTIKLINDDADEFLSGYRIWLATVEYLTAQGID
jgi:hypothetical protein